MPLVQCPDCGKEISDQAPTCPNCGRPMGSQAELPVQAVQPAVQVVQRQVHPLSILGLVLGGGMILGSFLPWAQVLWVSIAGTQGDGIIVLILGVLGAIAGLDGVVSKRIRLISAIVMLLAGGVGAVVSGNTMTNLVTDTEASLGSGLIICLVASALLGLVGLMAIFAGIIGRKK